MICPFASCVRTLAKLVGANPRTARQAMRSDAAQSVYRRGLLAKGCKPPPFTQLKTCVMLHTYEENCELSTEERLVELWLAKTPNQRTRVPQPFKTFLGTAASCKS